MGEIGHSLGLGHPHDNWGGSTIMSGISNLHKGDLDESFTGIFKANQFPYTVMSYFDIESKLTSDTFWNGFMKTLGPIDIVAIQEMYGKNNDNNIGDNIYYLPTVEPSMKVKERVMSGGIILYENIILIPKNINEFSYWSSIKDDGGNDTISAENSSNDVKININESLVEDIENGGIFISKIKNNNLKAGFMIAKDSIIENIISGTGDDDLYENKYNNMIDGNSGFDTVHLISDKNNYIILKNEDNTINTININNNNEINILKNIEKIVFNSKDSILTKDIVKMYPNNKGFHIKISKKT